MTTPNEPTDPDEGEGQPVTQENRSGTYLLACGHRIVAAIDIEQRHRCPTCRADTIVIRVLK